MASSSSGGPFRLLLVDFDMAVHLDEIVPRPPCRVRGGLVRAVAVVVDKGSLPQTRDLVRVLCASSGFPALVGGSGKGGLVRVSCSRE